MNPQVELQIEKNAKKYLEITHLTKSFPGARGPAVIVEDFDLPIRRGEFVSLIGHSGCGKSTVLSIVAGLTGATEGGVILDGREVTEPGTDRGVVFQSPCLLPWMTAFDNVMLAVEQAWPSLTRPQRGKIVDHYLALVGLEDAGRKRPAELSQGMRQRVGLARAFSLSPKVLLLDEPFGMLDSLTRMELQDVLIELWSKEEGGGPPGVAAPPAAASPGNGQGTKTALMVTHDVDEALFLSDRIAMMTSGPNARLGGIIEVPFARPRNRTALLEDPRYYELRDQLIGFLNGQAHPPDPADDAAAPAKAEVRMPAEAPADAVSAPVTANARASAA
jgi:nitrate/nitrite transport system ATP-binding protein